MVKKPRYPAHSGPMSLREWLVKQDLTQREFAQRLTNRLRSMGHQGVTQQTVSRWLNISNPTLEMIEVISEETGGEVDYKSFHMAVKYEGDVRLVESGKMPASILTHWRK